MSFTAQSEGGAYAHVLTIDELPSHNHLVPDQQKDDGGTSPVITSQHMSSYNVNESVSAHYWFTPTDRTGGNKSHNNMPPYKSVYLWRRTN